jgi:hypothetical protein
LIGGDFVKPALQAVCVAVNKASNGLFRSDGRFVLQSFGATSSGPFVPFFKMA